ncbi:hypothetical protein HYY74_05420 [Candidatus Woesearchaeota archaeon]|nr:hypothetical protein [Candidatus Woesearchaeota archaeon]
MAKIIPIPVKTFPDGSNWLILSDMLGKRVIIRAHEIDLKQNVQDYDAHHCPEAHAKSSVKCRPKGDIDITDKIQNY